MNSPPILRLFPNLFREHRVSWVRLVDQPTPVHALPNFAGCRLYVKREDLTAPLYGGNKVRNLEFLLGTAIQRGAERVTTVAPYGSNFVAAMAAQSRRIGLPSEVNHFVPARSPQMEAHAIFSAQQGMRLQVRWGGRYLGLAHSYARMNFRQLSSPRTHALPAGGSNAVGVLGHVNALLELRDQIDRGELPEPDVLVVGVGTCGTMAGLLAGVRLLRLKTRVIGVRCVDAIVSIRLHVSQLANQALRLLGSRERIRVNEVDLREGRGGGAYGMPLPNAEALIERVRDGFGLELDTTYTTKVFAELERISRSGVLCGKDVLYWNTYCPAATMNAKIPGHPGSQSPDLCTGVDSRRSLERIGA